MWKSCMLWSFSVKSEKEMIAVCCLASSSLYIYFGNGNIHIVPPSANRFLVGKRGYLRDLLIDHRPRNFQDVSIRWEAQTMVQGFETAEQISQGF